MISGAAVRRAEALYGIAAYTVPKKRPVLVGGSAATKVSIPEHYSTYTYDATLGTYQKTEEGHLYRDASLRQQLHIEMLITLHTSVQLLDVGDGHGAHIHDYNLDSVGKVDIYYKGHKFAGTWSATSAHSPVSFTLASGQALSLPPGLVWIDITS